MITDGEDYTTFKMGIKDDGPDLPEINDYDELDVTVSNEDNYNEDAQEKPAKQKAQGGPWRRVTAAAI